jgi:hypothetical protein
LRSYHPFLFLFCLAQARSNSYFYFYFTPSASKKQVAAQNALANKKAAAFLFLFCAGGGMP